MTLDEDEELTAKGYRDYSSPPLTAVYIVLVLLGIVGNATVIGVIGIFIQRVVSAPDGCLGVAAIGQRVVNTLPQCVPPPDFEACSSHYEEPSQAPGRSKDPTAEYCPHSLMLMTSTTRPLMGCVWDFPSNYSGLAYATTSMVIHEVIPIALMVFTNLGSLYTLYTHGRKRSLVQDAPVIKRVPAERRAAKVILALIMLFIASWGTNVISVNYFNYNSGSSAQYLLVIARFAYIMFILLSPVVLAVGHRQLRSFIKSLISH
ncbi:uncharacterized protein AKAME5_001602000 [Lates japonicus]|uniref:Vomeronasal type-1 receptor n=1 Tax=Lates japonicus TaxID=270547 RepID=A0AAD3N3U5_LATJO|nr:uncharacterized protein AKAME5_001602000 [Lates japonicus]